MTASGRSDPNWSISRLAIIEDPSSMAGRLFGLGVERNEAACGGGHALAQWPDPPQRMHCVALAARDLACEGLPLLEGLPPDVFLVLELWSVRKQQLVHLVVLPEEQLLQEENHATGEAPEINCPRGRIGAHVGAVSNFISFVEGGVAVLLGLILLFPVFIVLVVHRILLGRVGKALLVLVSNRS